jgi:hypothetical protein
MTDAPERMWAEMPGIFDGMGFWREDEREDHVEYIRADILAQALAANAALVKRLEEARELLELFCNIVEHSTVSDGMCCCGDDMDGHANPMNCGHSPVDHGGYTADGAHKAARAFLAGGE